VDHRHRQGGDVARGRHLPVIGETVRVHEIAVAHAELAGTDRHEPGEILDRPADPFRQGHRDIIGRLGGERADRLVDADRLAGAEAELRRRHGGSARAHRHPVIEAERPRRQPLEHHVEGHHLGDRRGVALRVGLPRIQDFAGPGVDHEGRIFRLFEEAESAGRPLDHRRKGEPRPRQPDRQRPDHRPEPRLFHVDFPILKPVTG